MKALIFGAEGMLGSALMRSLPDAYGTTKGANFNNRLLPYIDITSTEDLRRAFDWSHPQVVINCAGIVKSECASHSPRRVISVNGFAPRSIATFAGHDKCRFVQFSTDCVFSGLIGNQAEEEAPDAADLYGASKAAGEIFDLEYCVTLRTSFIGRDRKHGRGLLEWLLARNAGTVPGYARAIWSGLSTLELARVTAKVIENASLSGLYNVAGPVISKAELLKTLVSAYGLSCSVQFKEEPHIDRSLNGSKFAHATGYIPPSWVDMSEELARDDR